MDKGCVMKEVKSYKTVGNFQRPKIKNPFFHGALASYLREAENKRSSSVKLIFVHEGRVNESPPYSYLNSKFD